MSETILYKALEINISKNNNAYISYFKYCHKFDEGHFPTYYNVWPTLNMIISQCPTLTVYLLGTMIEAMYNSSEPVGAATARTTTHRGHSSIT